jgi:uncharacterized protein YqjF (DUF2071 family)
MHPALQTIRHRPWPIPERPWTWRQRWDHLLFAHWALEPDALSPHLPEGVELQTRDGGAWLAVVLWPGERIDPHRHRGAERLAEVDGGAGAG